MANAVALIDGFNVYHALDSRSRYGGFPYHKYKWIDYWKLASCFVPTTDSIQEVLWFTAEASWKGRVADGKRDRHRRLRRANEDQGVKVVDGFFRQIERTCNLQCPRARIKYKAYEEKRTDVAIAVTLVRLAYQAAYDKVVIISADSDLIPAIQEAKTAHETGQIINVVPIERRAEALKPYVDQQIRMTTHHLCRCQFQASITLRNGKTVTQPSGWRS